MAAEIESVLLEVINTKHKKNTGTLRLLTSKLIWIPQGHSEPKISTLYSQIKVQRISPEGSSKVQLQVVLHDGNSYSFQFTNNVLPHHTAKKERDEVKDLLAQLIPAHRQKAGNELEEKKRLLKNHPELYQLYKDLVVSEVLTPEEFWTNRAKMSETSTQPTEVLNQPIGLSSAFLADMRAESSGCNELKYNLNADTIEAIFKTYPAVKEKHKEVVPHEMSEKEFWTKFFQSQYFHRDRLNSRPTSSDMFTDCAIVDEQEQLKVGLSQFKNPLLDLTSPSPLPEEGYGLDNPDQDIAGGTKSTQSLFRRLNHHSLMVLNSTTKKSTIQKEARDIVPVSEQNGEIKEEPFNKKARVRENIQLEDLSEIKRPEPPCLKIADTERYCQGPFPSTIQNGDSVQKTSNGAVDLQTALQYCQYELYHWQPCLPMVLPSEHACHVLTELSPGGALMDSSSNTNLQQTVPTPLQTELKQHYNALSELLRHFWSCFPVTSQFREEKVIRMGQSLEKYRSAKLSQFESKVSIENPHLANHLVEMLEQALTKYRTWQEKRTASKLGS